MPSPTNRAGLTLVDPNPAVLDHCATTLRDWAPTMVEANVLEPLPVTGPSDSVGLSHVLHCLPGPMANKARAIEHIAAVLTDDGVLFGGTLGPSADHTAAGRAFLWLVNLHGAFGNRDNDIDALNSILDASFEKVEVTAPSGTIAYFVASRPQTVRGKNGGRHRTNHTLHSTSKHLGTRSGVRWFTSRLGPAGLGK